jgi:hypothetical protein
MRKLLLATVATAALSLPAMAQNNADQPSSNPPQQQMTPSSQNATGSQQQSGTSGAAVNDRQSQNEPQSQPNNQQAQNTIQPSDLNSQQIRQIQQALNKQGFDAGHVDGKWGSDTAKAIKDFQQQQHMQQANGKLDQQTLQALGVNVTAQGPNSQSQGASTTGQGSNEDLSPSQNPAPNASGGSGQNGSPNNHVNQH